MSTLSTAKANISLTNVPIDSPVTLYLIRWPNTCDKRGGKQFQIVGVAEWFHPCDCRVISGQAQTDSEREQ